MNINMYYFVAIKYSHKYCKIAQIKLEQIYNQAILIFQYLLWIMVYYYIKSIS